MTEIKVVTNILKTNDEFAAQNQQLLAEKGIFCINLMSAPGSGKTTILEKVIDRLKNSLKIAVIEGDIYTSKDAERIGAHGVPVVQINTEGACHLDANIIRKALDALDLSQIELLIIENVGNLVCPAEFLIGEDIKVMVLSTPEGSDKPLKYPLMFEKARAIVLNKVDLLGSTSFNKEEFYHDVRSLNPTTNIFETSCVTQHGIGELCDWLKNQTYTKIKKER